MKNTTSLGLLLIGMTLSFLSKGQPVKTEKIKALSTTYTVENYSSGVFIKNESNTLFNQKPNFRPEEISDAGLNLKELQTRIYNALKISLNAQQRARFTEPILLKLLIRSSGKIDGVGFSLLKDHSLTIQDIEVFEKIITKVVVPFKNSSMYRNVNFIPINMPLRPKEMG